jgi:hypothetical protein
MKSSVLFSIVCLLFSSCSNSKPKTESETSTKLQKNQLEITNDMENASTHVPSWINEKTVIAMTQPAAHSGKYACITNDTIEYSYTYQELLKNIISGVPKKVDVKGWIYTTVAKPQISIVVSISEKSTTYDWKAFPLADSIAETGKWVEFNAEFYMDKPLNPEQEIKIYAWNQSKKPVYIDDLKIRFEL